MDAPGVGEPHAGYQDHGLGVVSAFLFGPIQKDEALPRPICNVDNVRVFDKTPTQDTEYFDVLRRVQNTLLSVGKNYDIAILCCGPDSACVDGEPSAWSAVLDPLFATLDGAVFSAVGNSGDLDRASGLARVQPPADCVNAISVGAFTGKGKTWRRSVYSCVGPGRRPGYVKPDILAYGGELPHDPFYVLGPAPGTAVPRHGTSYAAPYAARIAAAIRASLGNQLSSLAIKALLINRAIDGKMDRLDVGWGRILESPDELISTADNEAAIIYQGSLIPGQYRVALIPLPDETLPGQLEITATFCLTTQTDPHHPLNYTRAGLEVTFRPDETKKTDPNQQRPDPAEFFKLRDMYQLESALRRDAWKWEAVMHKTKRPYGSSLNKPCFDVHYMAREESGDSQNPSAIPYALVLRLRSKTVPDLYNRIYRKYQNILVPLRPVLAIPVSVRRS